MDYEKKYNEALKEIRELISLLKKNDVITDNGIIESNLQRIFPELVESEDERIRKELITYLKSVQGETLDLTMSVPKWIAYLEKQKESNAKSPSSFGDEATIAYHFGLEEGIRREREKQKEQKPAEWKPQSESLEALMYAIEGNWEMIKPTSYLSRRLEDLYEGLINTYSIDETLLAELPKTAYTAKDIEELKVMKAKIDASMESPEDKPEERFAEAREKYQVEWSEEDEKKLNHILEIVHIASGREASVDEKEELESFLKSLRPQLSDEDIKKIRSKEYTKGFNDAAFGGKAWKPSEEQMEALEECGECKRCIKELYEQLKRLM